MLLRKADVGCWLHAEHLADADDTSDMVMPAGPPVKWATDHALITIAALLQSITTTTSVALVGGFAKAYRYRRFCCLPRQAGWFSQVAAPLILGRPPLQLEDSLLNLVKVGKVAKFMYKR